MTRIAEVERDLVIVACGISAGIHAALVPVHLDEGRGAGGAFALAATILGVFAVALTREPSPPVLAGAAAALTGSIVAYAVAISSGLPLVHPEREAVEGLALLTKALEGIGLLAAVRLLSGAGAARRPTQAGRPIPLGLTLLIASFSALAALAVSSGHTAHAHGGDPAAMTDDELAAKRFRRA